MKRAIIEKQAIEVMLAIVAAITNQRLYPPTSTLVVNTMNRLIRTVKSVLEQMVVIEYAEAEKALLIQGETLSEKDLGKGKINTFLSMLLDYKIKSIRFHQGITEQELSEFTKFFLRSPMDVEAEGGPAKIFADLQFTHIKIDEKVYVELDPDHRMVSSMNLTDDAIIRFVVGEESLSEAALEQVRDLVKDAEWVSRVFQEGIKRVMTGSDGGDTNELSERLAGIIKLLSRVSNLNMGDVSRTILGSLPTMDNDAALTLLTQNTETVFGENVFKNFVEEMDDDAFHRLLAKVRDLVAGVTGEHGGSEQQVKALHRIFQLMTASKKAAGLFSLDQLQAIKNEVIQLSPDVQLVKGMGKSIEILMSKGNISSISLLIERLGRLLGNNDPKVRANAVRMLLKIDNGYAAAERMDQREPIARVLIRWIKSETVISPEYEHVADAMEQVARHLIESDNPTAAEPIIEVYYKIYAGQLLRETEMRVVAGKMLRNLATDDLLSLLVSETRSDGTKKQSEGIPALGLLGAMSIERLLNRLHDTQNRMERNRMIHALTYIGRPAAKPIVERLLQKGPWYYLRNLILVLGRIGTEAHVNVLRDMLEDEDPRVQREAVFAIQNIAGANVGEILMKYLYSVDDEVKQLIISALGAAKYQPAVVELAAMLDENTMGKTRKIRDDIRIKICEALGRIGDADAAPALKKILYSKSFLAIKAHDPAVRAAAAEALETLKSAEIKPVDAAP